MKRIGILTFHRSINYGAYMQAYALSHEIQERFSSAKVEIVDFEFLFKHEAYKKTGNVFPINVENRIKYNRFQQDLRKLPLSSESFISNDTSKLLEYLKRSYDVLIVGSDAVWAFQKMKLKNPYWLFGDELRDVVKMSFAASAYSTNFQNVNNDEKLYIKEVLKSFNYIGVRDQETKNFINSIIDKTVYLNNDPTFFLEKSNNEEHLNSILRKNFVNTRKPIVSFMTRGLPFLSDIKNHLGNKYTFVHFNHRDRIQDVIDMKSRLLFNLSPLEWYNVYHKCILNFSQYFHGTVLGIINAVPTFSIDDTNFNYKYVGKNEQLMSDLKLNDYFFLTKSLKTQKNEKDRLFAQIDFALSNIDNEIERLKMVSIEEKNKSISFFDNLKSFI